MDLHQVLNEVKSQKHILTYQRDGRSTNKRTQTREALLSEDGRPFWETSL